MSKDKFLLGVLAVVFFADWYYILFADNQSSSKSVRSDRSTNESAFKSVLLQRDNPSQLFCIHWSEMSAKSWMSTEPLVSTSAG